MQNNAQPRIIYFIISLLLSIELVFLFGCESDLTDSLEGRPCTTDYGCLTGYECDRDANICVKDTEPEKDASKSSDANTRDLDGSTIDPSVDATTRESDSATNSNENEAGNIDATLSQSDAGAEDSAMDSHFEIDSGETAGQGGVGDAAEGGSSGGTPDTGSDAFVCGQGIEPTGSTCPEVCDDCEGKACQFICNSEKSCEKAKIDCPPDFDCEIQCTEKQACEKAKINCSGQYHCRVFCIGEQGCKEATINCDDGPCELHCDDGTQTCEQTELICGTQQCQATCGPGQDPPNVENCDKSCSADCDC